LSSPFSTLRTACRAKTRVGSAPAASRRGRMVSASPSSAVRMTTLPSGARVPSGSGLPLVTRAARSRASIVFPVPGSPIRSVSFASGIHGCQSHSTACGATSAIRTTRATDGEVEVESVGFEPLPLPPTRARAARHSPSGSSTIPWSAVILSAMCSRRSISVSVATCAAQASMASCGLGR